MDFEANKTPAEVVKEAAFGENYFRDIYSSVNSKWYRKSWKEFHELKILIRGIIVSQLLLLLVLIDMVSNVKHHQNFAKIKVGLILQIVMVSFNAILGTNQAEDLQTMKDKLVDIKEQ